MLTDRYIRQGVRRVAEEPRDQVTLDQDGLPIIRPSFSVSADHPSHHIYLEAFRGMFKQLLPPTFWTGLIAHSCIQEGRRCKLNAVFPLVRLSPYREPPFDLSFFVVYQYRTNAFKFIYEMIVDWLVPGKQLKVELFYVMDFHLPEISPDLNTMLELMVRVQSREEYEQILYHLPLIETELRLGVRSAYYAQRSLESKGLTADQKTTEIHQRMAYLVRRLPKEIDNDIFVEMQHVLVMGSDEFKVVRGCRHLSRVITVQYLFRNWLQTLLKRTSRRRHLFLKIYKEILQEKGRIRHVLGLIVGVNFLRDNEIFEERHLLRALQGQIENIRVVKDSFFANKRNGENVCTLYLEVERTDGQEFTAAEIKHLQRVLPHDLKDRIERPMHPIFNPRNEEEIMRNILTLGNQIKYVRDIPQVYISFDEQSYRKLFFTVILVRLRRTDSVSIAELFQVSGTNLEYLHDRVKNIGTLRRSQLKEATVCRVSVSKDDYLRADNSIDIFKARQYVVSELVKIIGELRDYNGGIISKQNELLAAVAKLLSQQGAINYFLLENFFYSLNPVIMRSVMEPAALKTLYLLSLEAVEQHPDVEDQTVLVRQDPEFLFVVALLEDSNLRTRLQQAVSVLQIPPTSLATAVVMWHDHVALGYIYRCDNQTRRKAFLQALEKALKTELLLQIQDAF